MHIIVRINVLKLVSINKVKLYYRETSERHLLLIATSERHLRLNSTKKKLNRS